MNRDFMKDLKAVLWDTTIESENLIEQLKNEMESNPSKAVELQNQIKELELGITNLKKVSFDLENTIDNQCAKLAAFKSRTNEEATNTISAEDRIQVLHNIDDKVVLVGEPRKEVLSAVQLEAFKARVSSLPVVIAKRKKEEEVTYEPEAAPEDMKEVMENKEDEAELKLEEEVTDLDEDLKDEEELTIVEEPKEAVVEVPAVEAPKEAAVEVPTIEAPKEEAVEVPTVESPKEAAVEVPTVEAPKEEAVEVPVVEAPKEETVEVPVVEAPKEEAVEVPTVEAPVAEENQVNYVKQSVTEDRGIILSTSQAEKTRASFDNQNVLHSEVTREKNTSAAEEKAPVAEATPTVVEQPAVSETPVVSDTQELERMTQEYTEALTKGDEQRANELSNAISEKSKSLQKTAN